MQALGGEFEHLFAVAFEREGDVRMRQREAFEHGGAVGVFGVFGFEELAPRGGVEEEFGSFDGGADGVGGGGGAAEFAVFGFDLGRVRAAVLAAGQCQAADRGDACQAFAAKAHAGDVFQIV